MSMYKHILVATDLTDDNNAVIQKGINLAEIFSAELNFVHVVEPLPGYGYAYVGVADIENQLIDDANEAMKKLGDKYGVSEERCHVRVGQTKIELMEVVEKNKIDCIILGSHGRHGFAELLGSTAHAVVHSSPCDVITVRIGS